MNIHLLCLYFILIEIDKNHAQDRMGTDIRKTGCFRIVGTEKQTNRFFFDKIGKKQIIFRFLRDIYGDVQNVTLEL